MRIAGITIPDSKRLEIGLTAVYGIGRVRATKILNEAKIEVGKKPTDLNNEEETLLGKLVSAFQIEGELRRNVNTNIKRLKDIKSYRGERHSRHLPVRGQRTKTNSRSVRGNVRNTTTSGRRKVDKK
ncbi:30S ribosomal protein S13 [Candidatus Kaiserbacteria bacterium]|nr:MAG: 30S ribosomal protein S13 [Candidatus Kaiserbacteria bacterium]